jgi:hypothetical protein
MAGKLATEMCFDIVNDNQWIRSSLVSGSLNSAAQSVNVQEKIEALQGGKQNLIKSCGWYHHQESLHFTPISCLALFKAESQRAAHIKSEMYRNQKY